MVVVVFLVVQTLQQDHPQQAIGLVYQLPVVLEIKMEVDPQLHCLGLHHVHHHCGPNLYHSNPIHQHSHYQVKGVPFHSHSDCYQVQRVPLP